VFSSRDKHILVSASELSTHNYTDGSETAFSLSNIILNPRSITEIIDLQQILEPPRVRLPVIATGQPHNPAPFNSKLSTPPAPPITRSIPETISLGQGKKYPRVRLPGMATEHPDDPTMSNSQPQSPPVPPVPRSTPEISSPQQIVERPRVRSRGMAIRQPYHPTMSNSQPHSPPVPPVSRSTPEIPYNPATFSRQPCTEPTFNGLPKEIQAIIWKKTVEPRIVHIKYSPRPRPYAFYRVQSDQEAVVDL
jgi:hypothetical protein